MVQGRGGDAMLAAGDEVPGRKRGRPPGPRVDRAARREAVIDAAELEIGEHGSEFGLSGVGERMGYARSALYAVFDRRDDLLDAVAARHAGRLTIEMAAVLAGVDGGRERTQLVVEVVIGWVERHRLLATVLAPRLFNESGPASITAPIQDALQQALSEAGCDDRAAAPWAHALIGAVWAAAHWCEAMAGAMDRDELVEQLTELIWDGLAASVKANSSAE